MQKVRTLKFVVAPPFLLSLAARWGSALPDQGVPLYPLRAGMVHALQFGGSPFSSSPWMRAGVARCLVGVATLLP